MQDQSSYAQNAYFGGMAKHFGKSVKAALRRRAGVSSLKSYADVISDHMDITVSKSHVGNVLREDSPPLENAYKAWAVVAWAFDLTVEDAQSRFLDTDDREISNDVDNKPNSSESRESTVRSDESPTAGDQSTSGTGQPGQDSEQVDMTYEDALTKTELSLGRMARRFEEANAKIADLLVKLRAAEDRADKAERELAKVKGAT